ncbi:MAG: Na+/H+ antiporter subunit E [Pseudomonadales bacterium]|nr:Na+/H+ antiporter subunit E [Pseudomonadales bacterium]
MIGLFWNLLLANCWVFLTGSFGVLNYLFGFLMGYVVIALIHKRVPALEGYPQRLPRFFRFFGFFVWELLLSNYKIAVDIVTPPWHMQPGVIRYKLFAKTDLEITLVSNFISLTPGTLVLDVSEDKTTLFVHAMFLRKEEEVLADLRNLELRILEVIR